MTKNFERGMGAAVGGYAAIEVGTSDAFMNEIQAANESLGNDFDVNAFMNTELGEKVGELVEFTAETVAPVALFLGIGLLGLRKMFEGFSKKRK